MENLLTSNTSGGYCYLVIFPGEKTIITLVQIYMLCNEYLQTSIPKEEKTQIVKEYHTCKITVTMKSEFSSFPEKLENDCNRSNLPFSNCIMFLYLEGNTVLKNTTPLKMHKNFVKNR